MTSYEITEQIIVSIPAFVVGIGLAYMSEQLLVPRFRLAWLATVILEAVARLIDPPVSNGNIPISVFLMLLGAISCVFLFYRGDIKERVYTAVTVIALVEICLFIAYQANEIVNPVFEVIVERGLNEGWTGEVIRESLEMAVVIVHAITIGAFATSLFLCCKAVYRLYPGRNAPLTRAEFWLILLPPISSLLLCVLWSVLVRAALQDPASLIDVDDGGVRWVVCALFAVGLASILVVLRALAQIQSLNGEKERRITLEVQMDALKTQVEESEKRRETLRRLRHDLANTVTVVSDLAQRDPAALEVYIKDLGADVRSTAPEFKTGVSVADALLDIKAQTLREKIPDAVFDADRLVFGSDLSIAPYDLGIILSNALDNAVEGAVVAHEKDPVTPSFVRSSSFQENGFLFIRVENSVDPQMLQKDHGLLKSTKRESGHGLGLRNIQTVADKYDGTVDYRVAGGVFTLSIMLGLGNGGAE